jgi:hypothetical protein
MSNKIIHRLILIIISVITGKYTDVDVAKKQKLKKGSYYPSATNKYCINIR